MIVDVGVNSYVTEAELTTYAADRGITLTGDITILLAKSMDYLETRVYKGTKYVYNQPLKFPRILCSNEILYNADYFSQYPQNYLPQCEYDNTAVPQEIKSAQCIASLLIGNGYELQGTLGQQVKRRKVASLETEYHDNSSSAEQHRALNDILRPFIESGMRGVRA